MNYMQKKILMQNIYLYALRKSSIQWIVFMFNR